MKKTVLAIILLSAVIISSCKKENAGDDNSTNNNPPPSGKCLMTAIKSGSIFYFTYGYDANKNLVLMTTYDETTGKKESTIDYTYVGGKLSKQTTTDYENDGITITDVSYFEYSYNSNGTIKKVTAYNSLNELQGYTEYVYDGTKLIKMQSYDEGNVAGGYSTYEYNGSVLLSISNWNEQNVKTGINSYDASGNITSVHSFDDQQVEHTQFEMEYDTSKPNYAGDTFLKILVGQMTITPTNAIKRLKVYDDSQLSNDINFTYLNFTSNGYPALITANDNGVIAQYNMEYSCN